MNQSATLPEVDPMVYFEMRVAEGSWRTDYGRNDKGQLLYFNKAWADKNGFKDQVVTWNDGRPIGKIELAANGRRTMQVPRTEEKVINALKNHEDCKPGPYQRIQFVDRTEIQKKQVDRYMVEETAMQVAFNMKDSDRDDLILVLNMAGGPLSRQQIFEYVKKQPDKFLEFFGEVEENYGAKSANLKDNVRVDAELRRAIRAGKAVVKAGAVYYNEELLGASHEQAVVALMDTSPSGKAPIRAFLNGAKAQKAKVEKDAVKAETTAEKPKNNTDKV